MRRPIAASVHAGLFATALLASFLWAAAVVAGAAAQAGPPACPVPAGLFDFEPKFPQTLAKLERGAAVTIVVIGGGSSTGRAAGGAGKAWPARLGVALADRFPKASVTVINKSVARDRARDMVARFDADALAQKPDLVIWETGIADAVRATDLDDFRDDLQAGIEKLKTRVPEVALMDMQYSLRGELLLYLNRYLTIMHGTADIYGVGYFARNQIMRGWSEDGVFDYEVKEQDARRRLAIDLYDCIGKKVADFLTRRDPEGAHQ